MKQFVDVLTPRKLKIDGRYDKGGIIESQGQYKLIRSVERKVRNMNWVTINQHLFLFAS
ncbi:MAG: hypothetical protein Ta2E_13140 [Mycoplasmoidaceae bacterium]|nr:MAG: hypothetical protein Ta2E_13140 [Mycoplasmoidaceae bacterium]